MTALVGAASTLVLGVRADANSRRGVAARGCGTPGGGTSGGGHYDPRRGARVLTPQR